MDSLRHYFSAPATLPELDHFYNTYGDAGLDEDERKVAAPPGRFRPLIIPPDGPLKIHRCSASGVKPEQTQTARGAENPAVK